MGQTWSLLKSIRVWRQQKKAEERTIDLCKGSHYKCKNGYNSSGVPCLGCTLLVRIHSAFRFSAFFSRLLPSGRYILWKAFWNFDFVYPKSVYYFFLLFSTFHYFSFGSLTHGWSLAFIVWNRLILNPVWISSVLLFLKSFFHLHRMYCLKSSHCIQTVYL